MIYTKGGKYARLHKFGACHWSFIEVHDSARMETVAQVHYNSRCKFCWPPSTVEEVSETSQEESSEESGDEAA